MKRWEATARLDLGDHGMGFRRDDPQRMGLVELTDALSWVPREGADWSVPLGDVTVRTRRRRFGSPPHGVEVEIRWLRLARIRPGSRSTRALLKQLVARGADYSPVD